MVCPRCISAVEAELNKLNIKTKSIELGEVELLSDFIDEDVKHEFSENINKLGFELIESVEGKIVDKIKTLIIEFTHYKDSKIKVKFSEYLSKELEYGYSYLSNLFASVEGATIEHYLIKQKIERVKELLYYDELSLSEISYKLDYSSVAHLSTQFKKVTGMTPSAFKKLKDVTQRSTLDEV